MFLPFKYLLGFALFKCCVVCQMLVHGCLVLVLHFVNLVYVFGHSLISHTPFGSFLLVHLKSFYVGNIWLSGNSKSKSRVYLILDCWIFLKVFDDYLVMS